eukprot:scaffold317149_cov21-Tisochrysis_lutea.AAC.1
MRHVSAAPPADRSPSVSSHIAYRASGKWQVASGHARSVVTLARSAGSRLLKSCRGRLGPRYCARPRLSISSGLDHRRIACCERVPTRTDVRRRRAPFKGRRQPSE